MMLRRRRPVAQPHQAGINWAHPITNRLVCAINGGDFASLGNLRNAVDQAQLTAGGGDAFTVDFHLYSGHGMRPSFPFSYELQVPRFSGLTEYTIFTLQTVLPTQFQNIVDQDYGDTGVRRIQYRMDNADHVQYLNFNTGAGVYANVVDATATTAAEREFGFAMAATCKVGEASVWCNRRKTTTTSTSGTLDSTTSRVGLCVNRSLPGGATAQYLNGSLGLVYLFARVLHDSEILELVDRPWSLWAASPLTWPASIPAAVVSPVLGPPLWFLTA